MTFILSFWRDEEMWCLQRMFYFMNLQRPVFRSRTFAWLWPDLTFESTWTLPYLSFISSLDQNHEKQELLIERAQGQYLIDNDGEHYLDLINNVAHGKFIINWEFGSGFWDRILGQVRIPFWLRLGEFRVIHIYFSGTLSPSSHRSRHKTNAVTIYKHPLFKSTCDQCKLSDQEN